MSAKFLDLEVWQKLICKGAAQVPCSKHAALLTFHGDWCSRPSCVDSALGVRRAASCPSSSVVVAQRGTRLTSSSRPFNEKGCPQLGYCPQVGATRCLYHHSTLQADEIAIEYHISKPVLSPEDIFCKSSAKLEAVPLILASDSNSCLSLGVTNLAAVDSLQSTYKVPICSNGLSEPDGLRVYPDGKSHCDADSSLIVPVPEVTEKKMMPNLNGSFPKTENASVLGPGPRMEYSEEVSKEETESKSRHVLAVSLLGTPSKPKTSLNRSFSGDGFNKPELPLESGSPLLVEMNHFGGEMRTGESLSGKHLALQALENLESSEIMTIVGGDGLFLSKATEETRQVK